MTEKNNIDSFVNKRGGDHSHIKGWGIDANPKNDPTYPMKHRSDEEIKGYTWDRPEQQETDIEVLHSIERPNITAVFGTAAPPSVRKDELAAVSVPCFLSNAGLSLLSFSIFEPALIPLS